MPELHRPSTAMHGGPTASILADVCGILHVWLVSNLNSQRG